MIDLKTAILIHDILIDRFGGSKGIRNIEGLEAAIARPYVTFDQKELYPNPEDKASALFESMIINHPFIDGNKRTAYFLLRLLLLESGFDINASEDEKYEMTLKASKGQIKFDEIQNWIKTKLISTNR